jgi:hypothetical protein
MTRGVSFLKYEAVVHRGRIQSSVSCCAATGDPVEVVNRAVEANTYAYVYRDDAETVVSIRFRQALFFSDNLKMT